MENLIYKSSVAIIGANGYLGRHLSNYLTDNSYFVYNYDIHPISKLNNYTQLDIRKVEDFEKIPPYVSHIFHLSGITGTQKGFYEYRNFMETNEIGLLNLLSFLSNLNITPMIVYPSTRLVYKGRNQALKEEDEKEAKTIYAVNKLASEYLLKVFFNRFCIPFNIFRICVPYGNNLDDEYSFGTVGNFLSKASSGQDITIFGDGLFKRTFTHINDICHQIYNILSDPSIVNETFNVAGETFSLIDVASYICNRYNVSIVNVEWPEDELKIESGHTFFDSTKISSLVKSPINFKLFDWVKHL